MKIPIILAILLLFLTRSIAQNVGTVSGVVSNTEKSVEGATISLLRAKDSSVLKLSASGKEGHFKFENLAAGKYLVAVTAVNHQKAFSKVVTVSAEKPNVEIP